MPSSELWRALPAGRKFKFSQRCTCSRAGTATFATADTTIELQYINSRQVCFSVHTRLRISERTTPASTHKRENLVDADDPGSAFNAADFRDTRRSPAVARFTALTTALCRIIICMINSAKRTLPCCPHSTSATAARYHIRRKFQIRCCKFERFRSFLLGCCLVFVVLLCETRTAVPILRAGPVGAVLCVYIYHGQ